MYTELSQNYQESILPLSHPDLQDLRLNGIGFSGWSHIDDNYVILRSNGYYQHLILYTLSGEGWMRTEHEDHILKRGDVWISPAGTPHEYGLFGSTWRILWISLSADERWEVIGEMGTVVRKSELGPTMLRLFSSVIKAASEQYMNSVAERFLLGELLKIYIDRELSLRAMSPRERELRNSFSELFYKVGQEIHVDWTIDKLQELMSRRYGRDHFIRLCREYYGQTPMKAVLSLKMQRAWELVCNTNLTIQTIAEKVGYSNPFAFTTTFRKFWKMPPLQARKQSVSNNRAGKGLDSSIKFSD